MPTRTPRQPSAEPIKARPTPPVGPPSALLALMGAVDRLTEEDAPIGVLREIRWVICSNGDVQWEADLVETIGSVGDDDHPWRTADSRRRDHIVASWARVFSINYVLPPAAEAAA